MATVETGTFNDTFIHDYRSMYTFSTARWPENTQPSGTINFSRIGEGLTLTTASTSNISIPETPTLFAGNIEAKGIKIDGVDVSDRITELENELENAKEHIQKLYDEVEKILFLQPGTGAEYDVIKKRFEATSKVYSNPPSSDIVTTQKANNSETMYTRFVLGMMFIMLVFLWFTR